MGRYVAWPPPDELRGLLHRAQQGEEQALEGLLTALRSPLLEYFSYRVPLDVAEDLAQVVLVRITQAIPRIDLTRADRYVITIARNLLRTVYRRRARDAQRCADSHSVEEAESRVSLDLDLEYRDLSEAIVRVAPDVLPPPLAHIVLALLRGETTAEIAAKQRVSPITIRTRLVRARAVLRRELRAYLESKERAPHDAA
jgi:RNA polymerase sigma factor (sigma-70 family)